MLIDDDSVKGDKEAKMPIWCLHKESAEIILVMLLVVFSTLLSQNVNVTATFKMSNRCSFWPEVIFATGTPKHVAKR